MLKVIIWGVGKRCSVVLDTIKPECCEIIGFIDNDPQKAGGEFRNKKIYTFKEIPDDFDYLLVAAVTYHSIYTSWSRRIFIWKN